MPGYRSRSCHGDSITSGSPHAIEKDTGAVPTADVELAKRQMTDFKRRMDTARHRPPRAAGRDAPAPRRPSR